VQVENVQVSNLTYSFLLKLALYSISSRELANSSVNILVFGRIETCLFYEVEWWYGNLSVV
jgi:hypothetical protein